MSAMLLLMVMKLAGVVYGFEGQGYLAPTVSLPRMGEVCNWNPYRCATQAGVTRRDGLRPRCTCGAGLAS